MGWPDDRVPNLESCALGMLTIVRGPGPGRSRRGADVAAPSMGVAADSAAAPDSTGRRVSRPDAGEDAALLLSDLSIAGGAGRLRVLATVSTPQVSRHARLGASRGAGMRCRNADLRVDVHCGLRSRTHASGGIQLDLPTFRLVRSPTRPGTMRCPCRFQGSTAASTPDRKSPWSTPTTPPRSKRSSRR